MTRNRSDFALFSMLRTPERESKFRWVGPLAEANFYFYKNAGASIELESLDDAKSVGRIGVTRYSGNESLLQGMGFANLSVVDSGAQAKNVELLVKGRIDLWVADQLTAREYMKLYGGGGVIEPLLNVPIKRVALYIAFSPGASDELVASWQSTIDEIRSDGTLVKIYRKYGVSTELK